MLAYIREWILLTWQSGHTVLATLSERFSIAAAQLGLRHVPQMFDIKHGTTTSTHYRSLAHVVAVITQDWIPPESVMGRVIAATVDWYWACRATSFSPAAIVALEGKCAALDAAWAALDTPAWRGTVRVAEDLQLPKGCVLTTCKLHRAVSHCPEYVKEWGPMEYITTETSEALHKPLKAFFRTYVCTWLLW